MFFARAYYKHTYSEYFAFVLRLIVNTHEHTHTNTRTHTHTRTQNTCTVCSLWQHVVVVSLIRFSILKEFSDIFSMKIPRNVN